MRDPVPCTDLLAHGMAEAARRRSGQGEREPGRQLVFGSDPDVVRRRLRPRERREQAPDGLQRHYVREGMSPIGKETFHRVVERPDPAREPKMHRRGEREIGVVDNRVEQ